MKKLVFILTTLIMAITAITFSACGGKNDSYAENLESSVPYIENLKCEYLSRQIDTEDESLSKDTEFSYKQVIFVKVNFDISEEAIANEIKDVTFKLGVPDGFKKQRDSANTGTFDVEELSYKYGTDKNKKECWIIVKIEFGLSEGEITFDFKFDDGEYSTANTFPLKNKDAFKYKYRSEIDGYEVSLSPITSLESVEIPSSYKGKQVKVIGKFSDMTALKRVEMPNTILKIDAGAFENCPNVKDVILSENLQEIGEYAFFSGNNQKNFYVSDIDKYVVINGLGNLGYSQKQLYLNNEPLTNVSIKKATQINDNAFYGYTNIETVEIGEQVKSIGTNVFSGCSSIRKMTVPFLGNSADNPAGVMIEKQTSHFGYLFGAEYYSENTGFIPSSLKEVEITGGNYINSYAFYYCRNITNIIFPETLIGIGRDAFKGCDSLTFNEYDNGLYLKSGNNEYYALIDVKSSTITSLTVNDNCKVIANYAFYNCQSTLTNLTLPDVVMSIGEYAFDGCQNLNYTKYGSCRYLGNKVNPYSHLIKAIQAQGMTLSYSIHQNCRDIAESAFTGCKMSQTITIPNGVKSIRDYTFYLCSGLRGITIPESVTSIGNSAFNGCYGLTNVNIPDSVKSIGSHAFDGCYNLTTVNMPNGLKSIGSYAFNGCLDLTNVNIPDSVKSIGDYAFYGCSSLTDVELPDSVTSIGDYAFYKCTELSTVKMGSGLTSIGEQAFLDCKSLTEIKIPQNVVSIGERAFEGCYSVVSIVVDGNNTAYKCSGNCLIEIATKTLLKGCNDSVIPNDGSVSIIGDSAFYKCENLTEIIIPSGVISIGNHAFQNCELLSSIELPSSLISIGDFAFDGCFYMSSGYGSIEIPKTVKEIGDFAFYGCVNLWNIDYDGTSSQWRKITKGRSWCEYVKATRVYTTDGDVSLTDK